MKAIIEAVKPEVKLEEEIILFKLHASKREKNRKIIDIAGRGWNTFNKPRSLYFIDNFKLHLDGYGVTWTMVHFPGTYPFFCFSFAFLLLFLY